MLKALCLFFYSSPHGQNGRHFADDFFWCILLNEKYWSVLLTIIQTGLHTGNIQFGSKIGNFCPVWPWNLMDDLEKQYGTPKQHQALCIISSSCVNSNWSYGPETAKMALTFDLDLDILHGHHFSNSYSPLKIAWWYNNRFIVKKVVTDRQTDRQTGGLKCS